MFSWLKKNKPTVGLIILLTIFTAFVPVENSFAQLTTPTPAAATPSSPGYAVMDVAVQNNTFAIANILSGAYPGAAQDTYIVRLGKIALKRVLRELTKSIVDWIDNGFDGNPSFITNTGQFLQDTADITIGDFLMKEPALEFLCDPFKIQVKLALGLQYRPFKEQIQCSFSSVTGNINDAYTQFVNGDFIAGGGWNSWLKLTTQPQNNQMGAMIIAQGELDARITGSTNQATMEANWGQGFLSWKDCTNRVPQPGDTDFVGPTAPRDPSSVYHYQSNSTVGCTIKTPGSSIVSMAGWANSTNIRQLEIADDLDAIFNAVANQFLIAGMGILTDKGLLGNGKKQADTSYNDYMVYLDEQQALLESRNPANSSAGSSSGSNISNTGINYSDATYSSKPNALALIDSLTQTQNKFLATQNDLYSLLDKTEKVFASSSASCSSASKNAIQNDVLNQITGTVTYDKSLPTNLFWNKKDIALATSTINSSLNTLNADKNKINNTSSQATISQTVQSLYEVPLYSEADANNFSGTGPNIAYIKNWIKQKQADASANGCNVDISTLGI